MSERLPAAADCDAMTDLEPGAAFVEHGAAPREGLVHLHLGESPFGTSTAAGEAAAESVADLRLYPDPARFELVEALAAHWDLAPDQVAVANGSEELVLLCALSVGDLGRHGLTTAGTFPGYRAALTLARRGVREVPLAETRPDVEAFVAELPGAGVGFLCNPHNPSGSVHTAEELDTLVEAAARSEVPLAFDEAYMDFAAPGTPSTRDYLDHGAPVLALRTLSKAYGLAALRVGYAIGAAETIAALRRAQGVIPFSVNRVAQAAAVRALQDREFVEGVRRANAERRSWLVEELRRRGRDVLPSEGNFVAVPVGDSAQAAERLEREHDILTRDTGAFGFPGHLRVTIGEQHELEALLDALDDVDPLSS
jgi:histidinol-phosphate aminotransferase